MASRSSPCFAYQSLYPGVRQSNAIRDGPPGIIGSNRRSSGRSPPRRGTIVQPLTGLPEVSTTSMQLILARMKTVAGFAVVSLTLYTFTKLTWAKRDQDL